MTVNEAATHLGVTPRTVRLWIESGRLRGERVPGKFGPQWRLDREQVLRIAEGRSEQPSVIDLARKPGGNDLRAIFAALAAEIREVKSMHDEYAKYTLDAADRLDTAARALATFADTTTLQALARQTADILQTVAEDSRARRRETQELQAAVQALSASLQEQADQVAALTRRLDALLQPRRPWYRRLFSPPRPSPPTRSTD